MDQYREHPSLARIWDGTRLAPAPDATAAESVVWFSVPSDPEAPQTSRTWEGLNARRIDGDVYAVCGSPALFAGIAFADRVHVVASLEGALVVTSIAGRGGYASARLWFERGGDTWRAPTEMLAQAGCVVDVFTERLVGISWPLASDGVMHTLERLESAGHLFYATA
jgi:hypothetical protein